MLTSLSDRLAGWSSPLALAALLLATLALTALFGSTRRALDPPAFDSRTEGYSAAEVHPDLKAMKSAGRRTYLWTEIVLDLPFPAIYGAFLAVWITLALGGVPAALPTPRTLNLLPVAAAVVDLAENLTIIALLLAFPRRLAAAEAIVPHLSRLKVWAISASVLVAIGLTTLAAGAWLWRRLAAR